MAVGLALIVDRYPPGQSPILDECARNYTWQGKGMDGALCSALRTGGSETGQRNALQAIVVKCKVARSANKKHDVKKELPR